MQSLLSILADSFVIWSRNFTLMYIILFFSLIVSLVMPQGETPAWEPRWFLLFGIILLMTGAILAGWFAMIARACLNHLERDPEKQPEMPNYAFEAFGLFREFLPGVSRYFPSVTVGVLLHGLVLFLLFIAIHPVWEQNYPIPEKLYVNGIADHNAFIQLPAEQQAGLTEFSALLLGAMLIYAIFSLVTMLWPAFVTYYRDNALKAYWRSLLCFLRNPFGILAIGGLFIGFQIMLTLLMSTQSLLVMMVAQFLSLLFEIYLAVVIFVYVYRRVGKPLPLAEAETPIEEPPAV